MAPARKKTNYIQSILIAQKRAIDSQLPEITRRAADEKRGGVQNGQFSEQFKSMSLEHAWIEQILASTYDPDSVLQKIYITVVPMDLFSIVDEALPTFIAFHAPNMDQSKKTTPLDRIFVWNYGDFIAYQRMKIEIPLPMLILLQREYFTLRHAISLQPTTERDVHTDISLDGPLLAPLY